MYIAAEAIWHIEEGQGYRWRGKIAGQEEKSVKGIRMEGCLLLSACICFDYMFCRGAAFRRSAG